ncbi:30S ribosomal protein S6e, partial [Candidatus Bathyarchaeota archaeon]|nr:30S ribosomal protein S6e [Candidatus Bathyarchaeota archaeon]
RKMVRGNTITEEIVQVNLKIVEKPKGAKESKKAKEKKQEPSEKEAETEAQPKSTEPSKEA